MAQFKGLDTFLEVVDVISNADKYKGKIDELKKVTASYKEAIEAVVKLAEVNDYTASIRDREEKSKKILSDAQVEAAVVLDAAKAEAQKILLDANGVKADLSAKLQEAKDNAKTYKEQLASISKEKDALVKQTDALEKEKATVEALKLDLQVRLDKLKSVMQ